MGPGGQMGGPMGPGGPPPGMPGGPGGPGGPLSMSTDKVYPPNQPKVFNPQNPNAPPIYPCGICHKEVHDNDQVMCLFHLPACNFIIFFVMFHPGDIMRVRLQLLVPPRVHGPGGGGLPLPHAGDLRRVGVRLLLPVQGRPAHQVQTLINLSDRQSRSEVNQSCELAKIAVCFFKGNGEL